MTRPIKKFIMVTYDDTRYAINIYWIFDIIQSETGCLIKLASQGEGNKPYRILNINEDYNKIKEDINKAQGIDSKSYFTHIKNFIIVTDSDDVEHIININWILEVMESKPGCSIKLASQGESSRPYGILNVKEDYIHILTSINNAQPS